MVVQLYIIHTNKNIIIYGGKLRLGCRPCDQTGDNNPVGNGVHTVTFRVVLLRIMVIFALWINKWSHYSIIRTNSVNIVPADGLAISNKWFWFLSTTAIKKQSKTNNNKTRKHHFYLKLKTCSWFTKEQMITNFFSANSSQWLKLNIYFPLFTLTLTEWQ